MSHTRTFGTSLTFRLAGRGRWAVCSVSGAYIERRDAEGDRRPGCYYVGPGAALEGTYAGPALVDAARLAAEHLTGGE